MQRVRQRPQSIYNSMRFNLFRISLKTILTVRVMATSPNASANFKRTTRILKNATNPHAHTLKSCAINKDPNFVYKYKRIPFVHIQFSFAAQILRRKYLKWLTERNSEQNAVATNDREREWKRTKNRAGVRVSSFFLVALFICECYPNCKISYLSSPYRSSSHKSLWNCKTLILRWRIWLQFYFAFHVSADCLACRLFPFFIYIFFHIKSWHFVAMQIKRIWIYKKVANKNMDPNKICSKKISFSTFVKFFAAMSW